MKSKKRLLMLLTLSLTVAILVGCGANEKKSKNYTSDTETNPVVGGGLYGLNGGGFGTNGMINGLPIGMFPPGINNFPYQYMPYGPRSFPFTLRGSIRRITTVRQIFSFGPQFQAILKSRNGTEYNLKAMDGRVESIFNILPLEFDPNREVCVYSYSQPELPLLYSKPVIRVDAIIGPINSSYNNGNPCLHNGFNNFIN